MTGQYDRWVIVASMAVAAAESAVGHASTGLLIVLVTYWGSRRCV